MPYAGPTPVALQPRVRAAAAVVALTAWTGLAIQFAATLGRVASPAAAVWVLGGYFTILTNLLVAVLWTGIAAARPAFAAPRLVGGATLAIGLVGVVYYLLLRGLVALSGADLFADWVLHTATPVLVPLYWLACVSKGALTRRDPLAWALYPLAYFAYALVRGAATHRYPYPFLDVGRLGWPRTAGNALAIALGFMAAGYAVVWLDGRLGRAPRAAQAA